MKKDRQRQEAVRVKAAHEAENQRVKELMKDKSAWQDIAKTMQSRLIEENLTQAQIILVMESMNATPEEIALIGPKLRAEGMHLLPDMWVAALNELRSK